MKNISLPTKLALFPFLFVLYEMATYLATDMYLPALPQMVHELDMTPLQAQYLLIYWFAGSGSLQLLLGPLADRFGRRPILLWGGVSFIIATVGCALTHNISLFLLWRFIQGSAVCSAIVAGYACIQESFDDHHAIRLLAVMSSIVLLSPAIGPLFGGIILQFANWRMIFWLLGAIGASTITLLYFFMPESRPTHAINSLHISALFSSYRRIISNWEFSGKIIVYGSLFMGNIMWISGGPFLTQAWHYPAWMFGIFQILIFGTFIIGAQVIKKLLLRYAVHYLVWRGLFCALLGSGLAALLSILLPRSLWAVVITLMSYALGASLVFPGVQRRAIAAADTEPMGARIALFSLAISLFAVLGSVLVSVSYNGTTFSIAGLIFAAALLSIFWGCWIQLS